MFISIAATVVAAVFTLLVVIIFFTIVTFSMVNFSSTNLSDTLTELWSILDHYDTTGKLVPFPLVYSTPGSPLLYAHAYFQKAKCIWILEFIVRSFCITAFTVTCMFHKSISFIAD